VAAGGRPAQPGQNHPTLALATPEAVPGERESVPGERESVPGERDAARHRGRGRWGGWARWSRWAGWGRLGQAMAVWSRAEDLPGRAFGLVTVLPALLLMAWLVPGIALLLGGRFMPVPMLLISVPVAVALVMLCGRDVPGHWPAPRLRRAAGGSPGRPWAAWWGLGGTLAVAVAFTAWQLALNSPQLIVSRDPGAYLQFGYWIAEHGSLPIPVSLAAFGGTHPGLTFPSFGFAGHGSALAPQFTAGLPITLSAGLWAHGIPGAVVMSPILGGLAVLAVGGLAGRLAGPQWAPLGAVLLALTVPEVYTSRSAFNETLVQALLFGGLCLVIDSLFAKRTMVLATVGGMVLGLTTLAWAGSLVVLLPLIVFAGALLAGRRPQAIPFTAGLLAGAALGVTSGIVLGVPLLSTATLSPLATAIAAGVFGVVTGAGAAVGRIEPLRRRAARLLAGRPLRWLPDAGAVVVLGVAAALAVRPFVQTVRGAPNSYVGALQRLTGQPVDPSRLYAEKSLYWLVWYLGVPALLLGVMGLAVLTRRCLRALLRWRDPGGAARACALPVTITGWSFLAVLWQPATVPDQPWASRRLVPVVLPGLVVLAVWVAAWLTVRAQRRGAGSVAVRAAAACFVVALAVPPAAITFEIGPWHATTPAVRTALTGLAFRRTGAGEYGADLSLCGALGSRASVLLLDQRAAREFGPVVRDLCGVPAGIAAGAGTSQVEGIIGGIERAGHRPVLLASKQAELAPYQGHPQPAVDLLTQQDAHVLTQPPTSTWPVSYVLWMSLPAGAVTGS
jgi:hypothetical protein